MWLLEELGLKYETRYSREGKFKAPKELKKIFPLGKVPIVQIMKPNGEVVTLAESGYIFSYFLRHYDTEKKLIPKIKGAEEKVDFFLHYLEGTITTDIIGLVVTFNAARVYKHLREDRQKINEIYFLPELRNNLDYLTEELKKSNGPYFLGEKLSVVDIHLSWPFASLLSPESYQLFTNSEKTFAEDYPELSKWMHTLEKEPNRVQAYSNIDLKL